MVATKQGFRPYSVLYARIENRARYNFKTSSSAPFRELEVGEFSPVGLATLVHFGDDNFGGEANSKLQVSTSGIDLAFRVSGWTSLVASARSARVTFRARGVQASSCPNSVVALVSSTDIKTASIASSDAGGNFSDYNLPVALPQLIQNSDLYVRIASARCRVGDYDDFEISGLVVSLQF